MPEIYHEISSEVPMTAREAERVAERNNWYGYPPAGYGGFVCDSKKNIISINEYDTRTDTLFYWGHYRSCD